MSINICSPNIAEAAVVGIANETWGQKVAAVITLKPDPLGTITTPSQSLKKNKPYSIMDLRRALKDRLVNYKIPQELKVLEDGLPRNAMGKVNKKALVRDMWPETVS